MKSDHRDPAGWIDAVRRLYGQSFKQQRVVRLGKAELYVERFIERHIAECRQRNAVETPFRCRLRDMLYQSRSDAAPAMSRIDRQFMDVKIGTQRRRYNETGRPRGVRRHADIAAREQIPDRGDIGKGRIGDLRIAMGAEQFSGAILDREQACVVFRRPTDDPVALRKRQAAPSTMIISASATFWRIAFAA